MTADFPPWTSEYVGLPYLTGGRDRNGVDCWGLMCMVWREQLGRPLPPYEGLDWYDGQRPRDIGSTAIDYASQFVPVALGEERLGDGVLIRMRGHPFHLGLVLRPGWMLHTHDGAGAVIECYHEMKWRDRISGIYRYEPHD